MIAHPNVFQKKRLYRCLTCALKFKTKKAATSHRRTPEHKEKMRLVKEGNVPPVNCSFCADQFESRTEMREHVWSCHSELAPQCPLCSIQFPTSGDLAAHAKSNCQKIKNGKRDFSQSGKYRCDQCLSFRAHSALMVSYHKCLKHGTNPSAAARSGQVVCCICDKALTRSQLWAHLCTHSSDGNLSELESRKCSLCNRVFANSERLRGHLQRAHPDSQSEEFRCEFCEFKTRSKAKLKSHQRSSHDKENFLCTACDSVFVGLGTFNHHLKIHQNTSANRKLFKCDLCPYFSDKKRNLTKHEKSHSADLRLSCKLCSFVCKWNNELKRHMIKEHQESSGEALKCDDCDYVTRSSQHLKRHVLSVHTEKSVSPQYKCRYCHYSTTALDNLRKHVLKTRSHPGAPLYFCSLCDDFTSSDTTEFRLHLSIKHFPQDKQAVKTHIDQFFRSSNQQVTYDASQSATLKAETLQPKQKRQRKQQF